MRMRNRTSRRWLLAWAWGLGLTGCASLDPHGILTRRVVFDPAPMAAEATPEARRKQREAAIDLVWTTIRDRYYRADLNGVDWAAARAKWAPLALAAASDDEFWERLDRMAAELADSHTRVESPRTVELRQNQQSRSLGFTLAEIEQALIVSGVQSDSQAFWGGVRPGMELETIAGEAALSRWQAWRRQARAVSTEQAGQRLPMRDLLNLAENGVQLGFRRFDGSRFTLELKPQVLPARPTLTARRLPNGVAYVRFTAFRESLRQPVLEAIREHAEAPGLVLDLRGNPGGSAAMVDALASAFFRKRTVIARTQTRSGEPVRLGLTTVIPVERVASGQPEAYSGPVAVLIDAASASASEALASALQATGRARVFGETSCGCLLAFLGHAKLPGGGELAYSEVGYTDVRGERIEGRGIIPDEPVARSRLDLVQGRDRVLEAALAWLDTERGKPLSAVR